jgi:hypothetical protein
MFQSRLIQSIVLLSLFGVLTEEARAEPMLLVEIHKHGFKSVNFLGEPVRLEFATFVTDVTTQTVFGGNYTEAHDGVTFDAPSESIAGFERALSASTGRFWLSDGGHTPVLADADQLWNMPFGTYTTTVHAPRLGYGLTGYNLTRVAHTVSIGYFINPGGPSAGPTAQIRQTIALYGEVVPEPASFGLLVVAHLMLFSRRFAFHRALKLGL